MPINKQYVVAGAIGLGLLAIPTEALAAKGCIHSWAVPGKYDITGSFRGDNPDVTTARLSPGCRVYFQIPGVSSGGAVKEKGQCLAFSFKIEELNKILSAEWYNDYAIIP